MVTRSAQETRDLGRRLGQLLQAGDVVLLEGTLGSGKTVLAQGVASGLAVTAPVSSPTFVLIHEHQGRVPLYHIDLYRLAGAAEAEAVGLDEYLGGDGVAVVEWPGRAAGLLPHDHLLVSLQAGEGDESRRIAITASGERHRSRLAALAGHPGSGAGADVGGGGG